MIPVILSGGSGTRLWPVSRASMPKQFSELFGESLLERTLRRVRPLGDVRIVAGAEHAVLVRRALDRVGASQDCVMLEPRGRNTAPAIALVCHLLRQEGLGSEIVATFPSDHLVENEGEFLCALNLAEQCAEQGQVATLGIRPTEPATGFGYIEVSDEAFAEGDGLAAFVTRGFHEKPEVLTAVRFVESGQFSWNAGMFVFRVDVMAEHFAKFMPALWSEIRDVQRDCSNLADVYDRIESESIDYGVMEHLDAQVCIPCDLAWNDVGSWDEIARLRESDADVFEEGGARNYVHPNAGKVYGFVGVEDLIVVDTDDALLIAKKGSTQGVKRLWKQLHKQGRREASEHQSEVRPWGDFEILGDAEDFKSKVITVNPGQRLSYQSHDRREEHWVIVTGHPEVTLDDEVVQLGPGDHVHIPIGAKHRIANPGDDVVRFVEVQLGTYFGEDDIVRYSDDYART